MNLTIPANYKTQFETLLVKLNKKATKQGLQNLTASFGEIYIADQTLMSSDSHDEIIKVEVIDIELSDHVPTFKGWQFVARVENLDSNENIFHGKTDLTIPSKFKTSGHTCEHCNQKRKRLSSYLLNSKLEGFKQVGSTCINDFLGNDKALNAFKFQDYIFIQLEEFERESMGAKVKSLLDVETVLAYSIKIIALHGFVKASGYEGYGPAPTANLVSNEMHERKEISKEHEEQAGIIKSHFALLPESESEYINKLSALCRANYVNLRNLNILVSAVATYQKKQRDSDNIRLESNWQGAIGDKVTLNLTIKSDYILADYGYGESQLITFQDETGNVYLWKSSALREIEKGDKVKLKGTIKEHSEFKGTKQTVLTRCKFID